MRQISVNPLVFAALFGLVCTAGCEGPTTTKKDPGATTAAKATTVAAAKTAAAVEPTAKTKPASATGAQPAATAAATAEPASPTLSNKPPTTAEWNAQTKEVTVTGSSKLKCETKMVNRWLRVSCRGKNDTGGTPKNVTITKGGGDGKTFTYAQNNVTSLVLPFVEGVDVEALFTWTDKKAKLHVWWPRGAPEPPPKGKFTVQ